MKKYLPSSIFLLALSYCCNNYAMLTYEMTMVVISSNKKERFPAFTVTEVQPYVNGGLVFTYPVGLFTANPVVSVTVFAAPHPSNITYTAEVCVESSSAATIMVYKDTSGVITEAANGEINVYLTATGI